MHNKDKGYNFPKLVAVSPRECTAVKFDIGMISDIAKPFEDCFVYWQSAEIVDFGYYKNGNIILNQYTPNYELLQELRIFNQSGELRVWKHSGKLRYRIRKDGIIENKNLAEKNCLIQKVRLWGTSARQEDNFMVVTEERGSRLSFPVNMGANHEGSEISIFLEEYRYIKEDENGCIYFYDRRFSRLFVKSGSDYIEMEVMLND